MKRIVVLYGSPRKETGVRAARTFIDELVRLEPVDVREIFLFQEASDFCRGCFRCFTVGETACPHHKTIGPLVQAMDEADGLVLVSPVYSLQMSGTMKAFLDHLSYCFINHRPRFYKKHAMVIVTTAGAGAGAVAKSLKQILTFWGVNRIETLGIRAQAISWEDMSPGVRQKARRRLKAKARRFHRDLSSGSLRPPRMMQLMMFAAGKVLAGTLEPDNPDRVYWEQMGWSDPTVVSFHPDIPVGPARRVLVRGIQVLLSEMWTGRDRV